MWCVRPCISTLTRSHCSPDCYKALAQLIEMLHRQSCWGQLDDAIPLLSIAENSTRASYDPGYSYCQGLYHWSALCVYVILYCSRKFKKSMQAISKLESLPPRDMQSAIFKMLVSYSYLKLELPLNCIRRADFPSHIQ